MKYRKIQGVYSQTDPRFGFLETASLERFFIGSRSRNGALDGDVVEAIAVTEGEEGKSAEAKVSAIKKRTEKIQYGTFRRKPGKPYAFVYLSSPEGERVYVSSRDSDAAEDGESVTLTVTGFGEKLSGRIVERLGMADDFNTERETLVRKSGIPLVFHENTIREAEKFDEKYDTAGKRESLNGKIVITIDGADAKDLDDAVSIVRLENGAFELGVHIADVAEYVREGSALDREALRRGTSVYLSDRVIPMLPEKLSNGLCSLHPGSVKKSLSIFLEIATDGSVKNARMAETEFLSSRRCTYDEVQSWHDRDGEFPLPPPEIVEAVEDAFVLAKKIDARRDLEGRLDFDIPELKIEIGPDGEPTGVKERQRKASHRLIETFMVIANEEVSRLFHKAGYPFVFRVHEAPSEDNRSDLRKLFKENGIDLPEGEFTPKDLRTAYEALKKKPGIPPMEKLLLSRLSKAKYSEKALGHFGLALKYYSHFTSPIRRYPDLQIHRIIKEKLRGELTKTRQQHFAEILPVRSKQNSDAERRAETLEREIEGLEAARYMERFVGEEFDAVVTGSSRYAYYVRIPEGIEGAVFLGKNTEKDHVFPKFGTPLRVRLTNVDRLFWRIDFTPAGVKSGSNKIQTEDKKA